jgi:integrase
MAKEVRRDNKGRILRTGESQRPDGRYMYKNSNLGTKPIYSWKLVPTDKVPKNKRPDLSLREKIAELEKDLSDGIDPAGKKMTVCQLYNKQNSLRKNVKRNTVKGRKQFMNLLKKDFLGSMTIDTVKLSDAKAWAIRMSENGIAYSSIRNYKRSLKASFYLAIQDDYIRKNPFDFKLSDVLDDDTEEKIALTSEQETNLLAFMKVDKVYRKYYDEVVILLNTGLRISELCGLTLSDIDMRNRSIDVNHQLLKDSEIGYYIELPKTKNGKREIPMAEQTYQAFKRLLESRENVIPFRVENHSNFLFNTQAGFPKIACNYDSMLRGLVKKYNKTHDEQLPHITPHTFRHTFCTNMANKGMNPNTLQYIMGHSNITMTLNYYAHGSYASAKAEMDRLYA